MSEIPDAKGTMPDAPQPVVVALEPDLFFAVRIESAARAAGARPLIVEDAAALWQAIEAWPALALIDLAAATGWAEVVRRAKSLPEFRAIPIVAFGSHVDTDTLKVARTAGCDHAWARSHFTAELPQLIQRTLHPPTRWVVGWDEPPPPALLAGIAQFNAGEYWECHETLEMLWRAEPRPVRDLYQGILQIGVAFHHLRHDNTAGALKMLRRGLPRLRDLPEVCQGVRVTELAETARMIHDRLAARRTAGVAPLDSAVLPTITIMPLVV